MATVPWIRFYTSFPRHRKTVMLKRELGTYEPIVNLWCWAADNAQDGNLAGFTVDELEDFAGWKGRKGAAINALLSSGFLDENDGCFRLHDWMEGTGAGIESLMKTRNRQRDIMKQKRNVSANTNTHSDAKASQIPLTLSVCDQSISGSDRVSDCHADSIRLVFDHYRKLHPRAFRDPQPGTKEWRLIRDRLKEGTTVEELFLCIDGYHKSPYHTGQNDTKTRYLDLELFVRDGSHVSKGIELASEKPKQEPRWGGSDRLYR